MMSNQTSKYSSKLSFNEEGTQILTISKRDKNSIGLNFVNAIGGIENQVMPKSYTMKN